MGLYRYKGRSTNGQRNGVQQEEEEETTTRRGLNHDQEWGLRKLTTRENESHVTEGPLFSKSAEKIQTPEETSLFLVDDHTICSNVPGFVWGDKTLRHKRQQISLCSIDAFFCFLHKDKYLSKTSLSRTRWNTGSKRGRRPSPRGAEEHGNMNAETQVPSRRKSGRTGWTVDVNAVLYIYI